MNNGIALIIALIWIFTVPNIVEYLFPDYFSQWDKWDYGKSLKEVSEEVIDLMSEEERELFYSRLKSGETVYIEIDL